ncbi:hypothetical protein RVF87_08060 [Gordonia hydrophobica]|uniref:Uncharacterized protein n=1 Tax=Gordonia hydrophobica TaxID=40516 RepID=A0ABZ2U5T7_9ACTN|nr:hypothetical protein [Gordonia hydrophobica]MBM7368811.1 hypothetical protein [Gordonia hydrophobica]
MDRNECLDHVWRVKCDDVSATDARSDECSRETAHLVGEFDKGDGAPVTGFAFPNDRGFVPRSGILGPTIDAAEDPHD